MRIKQSVFAVIIASIAGVSALAQQPPNRPATTGTAPQQPRPTAAAPATSAPVTEPGDPRIAVIDITEFANEKGGIARLINAYVTLERDLKTRQDELTSLQARRQTLAKEYENLQKVPAVDQRSLQNKADDIQTLDREIKHKQEDAQQFAERREQELTTPIWEGINAALRAYAQQRGISIILEKGRLAGNNLVFFVDEKADITRGLIIEYNQRNPATTPAPAKP